ncbi:MAG: hypothetical protein C0523_06180 [Cytophaga sp.]|nr:hypothetical protein [Cytophaga sp.]
MKRILVVMWLLAQGAVAQVKNGDVVPDLSFRLLNAPVKTTSMAELKGKVVMIEFWATWCGSCIAAMPHLKELQAKYPEQLRIISVSQETPKRILQFLKARPSEVWFASDSLLSISTAFPHHIIPHTVLISPDGKLVANTSPELVTEAVIGKLLKKQEIKVEEKTDNTLTYEEIINSYFHADDSVKRRFLIQPKIKGAPGFSTTYQDNSTFSGRRLTAVNCGLSNLYRMAYGDFPYNRTVDKIPASEKNAYCIDLIVPRQKELLAELKKELSVRFDVHAQVRPELKDTYALRIADAEKVKKIPQNTSGVRTYSARHGAVDQQSMTMEDLAAYLESFGVSHIPVVDETNDHTKYDIQFTFQPEDPSSLTKALADMGLELVKTKKELAILYLW